MSIKSEYKKLQKRCKTFESQLLESHHDIGILDFTNHKLEQEYNILEKRLKEYEEIYLQNANDSFDKCIHDIIAKYKTQEGNDFYKSTVGFLLSYIQALKSYSNGDTKSIMQKIEHYKNETYEAKKELYEFKMAKRKVLKRFSKAGQELSSFENMINKSI